MKKLLLSSVLWLFVHSTSVAEVYLSKEEALKQVLGAECHYVYEPKNVPQSLMQLMAQRGMTTQNESTAHFFSCTEPDGTRSVAVIGAEIGKHLPITYIIGISSSGEVRRVEMMVFREIRGWEVRERRFMLQYEGKRKGDDVTIGRQIRNVSGATLSAQAISRGVEKSLLLWEHFYGAQG